MINNIRDLKELLEMFEEDTLIDFGTCLEGFRIDSYNYDGTTLTLRSSSLEEKQLEELELL